jgi:hypothetical protein
MAEFGEDFVVEQEFPQRQKPCSFNLDRIMESINSGAINNGSN